MQSVEQLNMVSGSVMVPVLSVFHVAAVGCWPHWLFVVRTVLAHVSCSATIKPEALMGDLLESVTWYHSCSLPA